jgi:Flp pilus assembly protein TadD
MSLELSHIPETPDEPGEPGDRRAAPQPAPAFPSWIALAGILVFALIARVLYLHQFAALPFFEQPVGDSAAHLRRAADIAAGQLLPERPFYYCSIFYPYFLAAVRLGFGPSLVPVAAIQLVAGVLGVGLLAFAARRAFGWPAAIATAALAALYGPSAFFEADVLGVVWGQLGLILAVVAALAWWQGGCRSVARALAAGVALGFAAVERPNLLAIVPPLAIWMVVLSARRDRVRTSAVLLAGVAVPLAIVLALNVAGTGQWVPLTTSGGINLALGYHDGATGTYDEPWEREAPEFSAQHREPEEAMTAWASLRTGRPLSTQEASAYWGREAVGWIAAHPVDAALLTVRKAALMLNAAEVANHLDYGFIRARTPALGLMPLGFGVLLPLAVLGAWLGLRRRETRPAAALLLLVAFGAFAGVVPFTVADRYRAPMVPALLVLAGLAVVTLPALARSGGAARDPAVAEDRTRFAVPLVLVAAALAIAFVPLVAPLHGRDHWMLAQAWQAKGNLPAAIASYEAAVREEPGNAELMNNLASAYRSAGRRDAAIATLRRAVALQPALVLPHRNLGMALIGAGDHAGALAELRIAVRLDAADASTLAAIGALHAEGGAVDSAAAAFGAALRLAPADPRIRSLLAHYPAVAARLASATK